ncbi:MAG: heavy metal translocating P-type ATPase [bacterium]|nr:heavy metal translocating P-type ATPase [bacterium]
MNNDKTAIDPVCGMEVEKDIKELSLEYNGKSYYFCYPGCKELFEKDPEEYLKNLPQQDETPPDQESTPHSNNSIVFSVTGIHCASCVNRIERQVLNLEGVVSVSVNPVSGNVRVDLISGLTTRKEIFTAVQSAGDFKVIEPDIDTEGNIDESVREREYVELKKKLIFSSILTVFILTGSMRVMIPYLRGFPDSQMNYVLMALTFSVIAWSGAAFFRGFMINLKNKTADMNSLAAIGTSSAFLYSAAVTVYPDIFLQSTSYVYYDTAAVITTLILLGRFLEARAKGRTSEAVKKLIKLQPKTARVKKDNKYIDVPVEELNTDDIVMIKPGEKIPIDGDVVSGSSYVDESMLTGESMPMEKLLNSPAYSGTINQTGSFELKVTKQKNDTLLQQIIEYVYKAQSSKAPVQRIADRIAGVFVPVVVIIAVLTFLGWYFLGPDQSFRLAMLNFISVLIIACPCAMGLATPTAIMVASGKGAEIGVLFKNGESIENTGKLNSIVFDKTGTLTTGKPVVGKIFPTGCLTENKIIGIAASVEQRSEHPVGRAIVEYAQNNSIELKETDAFDSISGKGIRAVVDGKKVEIGSLSLFEEQEIPDMTMDQVNKQTEAGKTAVLITIDSVFEAVITIADEVKSESRLMVERLKEQGIEPVMISGDNAKTTSFAAGEVGIKEYYSEVLPTEKAKILEEIRKKNTLTGMVGDGINDAPALAKADIGFAIGTGTDIAIETADITIVSKNLLVIPEAVKLSKKTLKIVKQNLFWAFGYNSIGIPVAAGILYPVYGSMLNVPGLAGIVKMIAPGGFISPILAAFAMAMSSVSVVTNSLRLKRFKPRY